jgi:predicted MFS family arabinose efflux permease
MAEGMERTVGDPPRNAPAPAGPGRGLVLLMAAAAGLFVAAIYYNQPILGLLARDFGAGAGAVAQVAVATQVGYALGLLFLASLGDCLERRRLIVLTAAALALALAGAALAPSLGLLIAASLAIGALATVAQQVVPLAAHLAPDSRRGGVVGTVMAGLLTGILLARTASGLVSEWLGWREMFWLAAGATLVMGGVLAARLPRAEPRAGLSYPQLLLSMARLFRQHPRLRRAGAVQGLLFSAFVAFWSTLALYLERPPFSRGSAVAGLLGVLGAAGVLAAPLAGRLADRGAGGRGRLIAGGAAALALAYTLMGALPGSWPALLLGIVLMDIGLQAAMIANQSRVYGLDAAARSRLNTVYMTMMFASGSVGTAAGAHAFAAFGWTGVCALGGALGLAACLVELRGRRAEGGAA